VALPLSRKHHRRKNLADAEVYLHVELSADVDNAIQGIVNAEKRPTDLPAVARIFRDSCFENVQGWDFVK